MADAYRIDIQNGAKAEIAALRTFDARTVVDEIKRELRFEPNVGTRRRKRLDGVTAGFKFDPPLWELKVGEYRVYYGVNEADRVVVVRAVRWKGTRSTEEVLK